MVPKHLIISTMEMVEKVVHENKVASITLQEGYKTHPKWGSRDRRLVGEIFYDLVRFYYKYEESTPLFRWAHYWLAKGEELPDWPELQGFTPHSKEKHTPRETQSLGMAFDQFGLEQLGEHFYPYIEKMNQPAPIFLRPNTLKTSQAGLHYKLEQEGVLTTQTHDALAMIDRNNFAKTKCFEQGLFEVQDLGSQEIAPFCHPHAGETVLDCCAGAGGKTLHLAALMKNIGLIEASDIRPRKLSELQKRASRAGATIIRTTAPDKIKDQKYDLILIDAPCSGSGTIHREPEKKYHLNEAEVMNYVKTQQEILERYIPYLKVGGRLVYATCSIFPIENQKQTDWIKHKFSELQFEEDKFITPLQTTGDSFYMSRFKKKK